MECPKCRSNSVRLQKGARACGIKNCTFIDVHPISFDNDVMHYQGEDKKQNRFSAIYSSSLAGGGIELEKESNFDKNFKKGRKFIGDCCFMLKLNQNIIDTATARFLTILKYMTNSQEKAAEKAAEREREREREKDKEREKEREKEKDKEREKDMEKDKGRENDKERENEAEAEAENENETDKEKEKEKEENGENEDNGEEKSNKIKRQRHKNILSLKNMAAYSIYSACFQKESYFEQFYLSKILQMSIKTWKDLVKQMNSVLKGKIDFVPIVKPKHLIMRVCARRKIRKLEELAMVEMCENISNNATPDTRINTIAALAFWKVCEYSDRYQGKFTLLDFCKIHEKMQEEENAPISRMQEYFDVTPDNVRKVFKEAIKAQFFAKYLPNWQGRVPLHDNNPAYDEN